MARNVLVTGGSRGLGLAIVCALAAEGYNVVAAARGRSEALDAAMESAPGAISFRPVDLADTEAIAGFVRDLRKAIGPIYGLVNNAGLGTEGFLATMHNSQIEALVRLNTIAPMVLTKYVVRAMMADGVAGRIVNIASIIAGTGYAGLSVYGATKASLVGFTRSLAREVGRTGINVTAIAPGFVPTEMTAGLGEEQRDKIAGRSALRRLPEAEDVARMACFLLGEGGRNITGTVLTVDAGNTA